MSKQHSNKNTTRDITDSFQQMSKLSMDLLNASFQNNMKMANEVSNLFKNIDIQSPFLAPKKSCDCCPPEPHCPPHCLIEIHREAYAGEVIVVPFAVKNTCGAAKRYKIGVREMLDQNGNPAPVQPTLNRQEIDLQPGQTINVLMTVNLMQGVNPGDCFETDIVIREKDVNQNICFKLEVVSFCDVPVAKPLDERHYFNHWQSWKSHFYCEQKPDSTRLNTNISVTRKD